MMTNVDDLSRRFGSVVAHNLCITALLHKIDVANYPHAYNSSIGNDKTVTRLDPALSNNEHNVLILIVPTTTITSTR